MSLTKTGVVATVGPACSDEKLLKEMIAAGVSTFRLNFSHGTPEEHKQRLDLINCARTAFQHEIAVMGDLCGPKLRIGTVAPEGQEIKPGDEVTITSDPQAGSCTRFGTNYPAFVQDVQVGHRVMIDDGQLVLQVISKTGSEVRCRVEIGGAVLSRKGINLPDSKLSIPAITEKDWQWAQWAIENNLDYLALSFVQTADEICRLKKFLTSKNSRIRVVVKIEKPQAVENLQSIIEASDAALVARGDLGVEMDIAQVPLVQKQITEMCRRVGKPVIVATQVMQSMIQNASPTRAEASDAANAVMEYTDAIMLSGETAVGKYPLRAVNAVAHICRTVEAWQDKQHLSRPMVETEPGLTELAATTRAIAQMLDHVQAAGVVVWTKDGQSARLLSKSRVDVPILAICPDPLISRQISLHYGVVSVCRPQPKDSNTFIEMVSKLILDNQWAKPIDRILFTLPQDILNPRTPLAIFLRHL
jgi:pyruvate kinase